MLKKIGWYAFFLFFVVFIALFSAQIYLSRSPFISQKVVAFVQSALEQNLPPNFSIRIKRGSISLYNLSVYLMDIELEIPDSGGLTGRARIERMKLKMNPLYLWEDIFFIPEAIILRPRINLFLEDKPTKKKADGWDHMPAHSLLPSLPVQPKVPKEAPLYLPEGLIIRKLKLKEGSLSVTRKDKGSSAELGKMSLLVTWKEDQGLWAGTLTGINGHIKHSRYAYKIEALQTVFTIGEKEIGLQEWTVRGSGFNFQSNGRLNFEEIPRLDMDIVAAMPLDFLERVSPDIPSLKGKADIQGKITGPLSDPRFLARITVPLGEMSNLTFKHLSLTGEMGLSRIRLKEFFVQIFQGELKAQGEWVLSEMAGVASPPGYKCELSAKGLALEEVLPLFSGKQELPITGLIKADLQLRGKGFSLETMEGSGEMEIDPLMLTVEKIPEKDTPGTHKLSFKAGAVYSFANASFILKKGYIEGPGLALKGQGEFTTPKHMRITIESRLEPEKYRDILPFPITGIISFNGNIGGSLDKPLISGYLESRNLVIRKYPQLSYLKGIFSWNENIFSLEQGIIRDRESQLDIRGDAILPGKVGALSLSTLTPGQISFKNVEFYLRGFKIERLKDWFTIDIPLSGEAVCRGVLNSRGGKWNGMAHLELASGIIWQQGFKSLSADMELDPDSLAIKDLTLLMGSGFLRGNGKYYFNNTFSAEINSSDLDLNDIGLARAHATPLKGKIILNIKGGGKIKTPQIAGDIHFTDIFLQDLPLDKGFLRVELKDSVLQVNGSPLDGALLSGQINLWDDFYSKFSFDLQKFSLLLPLHLWKKELIDQGLMGWVSGNGQVRGNILSPESLKGEIRLSQMEIVSGEYTIRNSSPVKIDLQREMITLDKAFFKTNDAEISVAGEIALSGKQVIQIAGDLALPMLDRYISPIRITQGWAKADLEIVNDVHGVDFKGRIGVSGGAVEIPDVNQKLSEVEGEIFLKNGLITIKHLMGKGDKGSLSIQGNLGQERGKVISLDLTLQGKELKWKYPKEFSTSSNFLLYLKGKPSQPLLQGWIEFVRAKYVTKFDIKNLLQKFSKKEDSVPFRFSDTLDLGLDIELLTRDTMAFQSNLADLDFKGRLRLTGTLKKPILLGRTELEKGQLSYYNRKFFFTSGRLDFIDPNRFRPYYEFEAQGEVDKYEVKIISYGTPQQFNLNLYSNPPLSQMDIISLLSVGMTSSEVKSGKVSLSSAPSFVANRISQKITQNLQKTTGLDALEITPILEGSEGGSGVGIMTQKALGEDLIITYRSDTSTPSNEQLIEMEYRLTDHVSLIGMNSKGGSGGMEVKFSFTWE